VVVGFVSNENLVVTCFYNHQRAMHVFPHHSSVLSQVFLSSLLRLVASLILLCVSSEVGALLITFVFFVCWRDRVSGVRGILNCSVCGCAVITRST